MFAAMLAGFLVIGTVSGLFGAPCIATWLTVWIVTGVFQAIYWGWRWYGWAGAAVGAPIGVVVGMASAIVPLGLLAIIGLIVDPKAMASMDPTATPPDVEESA